MIQRAAFGMPSQPAWKKSPLKLMFGAIPNYAKPIQVRLSDTPIQTIETAAPAGQTNLFIQPARSIHQLFPQSPLAGMLLKDSFEKNPQQVLQHQGNLLTAIAETNPKPMTYQQAFLRALPQLPQDTETLAVALPKNNHVNAAVAQDLAEQSTLLGYNPRYYRQDNAHPLKLSTVQLANLPNSPKMKQAVTRGIAIGKAENLTRHLVDAHPGIKNPKYISEIAKALETDHPNLSVTVHNQHWIKEQKMGLFLAVAAGNRQTVEDSARLVEMVYTPPITDDDKPTKTVLLVGKGITFDTGGLNLKSSEYIHDMQGDMAGAAAVIGAMKAIAELQIPNVKVIGLTPLTPNRIGENATLPQTIAFARKKDDQGRHLGVEIDNTDAEGRLVLADAMNYGEETYNPDVVIDIATLTGGKARSIGTHNAVGVMGNNYHFSKRAARLLEGIGRKAPAWEITPTHQNWVEKGHVTAPGMANHYKLADLYNSVSMAQGEMLNLFGPGVKFNRENPDHAKHHAIQGGAFLEHFVSRPWIHLDMAGAEYAPSPFNDRSRFATGFGVKDLVTLVQNLAEGTLTVPKLKQ